MAVKAGLAHQLGVLADAFHLAGLLAYPYGQGGAPIALAAERPVHVVLEESPEAAIADVLGLPGNLAVVGEEANNGKKTTTRPEERRFRPLFQVQKYEINPVFHPCIIWIIRYFKKNFSALRANQKKKRKKKKTKV
jgi:hypothetical protein